MTNQLIENSIEIGGIGHPNTKTIFTVEEHDEKKYPFYKSLDRFCGVKKLVWFKYIDNEIEKEDKVFVVFPKGKTELELKDFIIETINNKINNK